MFQVTHRLSMSSSCILCTMCFYLHGMVYEYLHVSDPVIVWKEEQWHSCVLSSRWLWKPNPKTKPCWHTECRECWILLPPPGDTGQNRAIVPDLLSAINAPQSPSMTNTYAQISEWILEIFTYNLYFHINIQKEQKNKSLMIMKTMIKDTEKSKTSWLNSL